MQSPTFDRFAAAMAYLSALIALGYSVSFGYYVKRGDAWAKYTSSGLLMAGGLIGLPVLIALFQRVRHVDEGFALVGFLIAVAAAFGSVLHGAHDVAIFAHPEQATGSPDYPSFTDPRGFATFALFGLGLVVLSAMLRRSFSRSASTVGVTTGLLTIVVYIGRVTVLDPKRWWVAIAAFASGVIGVPLWNVIVGRELSRAAQPVARVQPNAPAARSASMVASS
jgi:hypothetical protein